MASSSVAEYWKKLWVNNEMPWHIPERNPFLVKHEEKLLAGRHGIQIFFPLCGKTVDMKWYYEQNHRVIGTEFCEKAILEFFNEQNLMYRIDLVEPEVNVYQTEDGRLKIFCCDVLKFKREWTGPMDAIWDRGAFVAIEKENRKSYVEKVLSLMAPNCTYLMEAITYNDWFFSGSPHNVPKELVHYLFGKGCDIEELETARSPNLRLRKRLHAEDVYMIIFLMTPKK